MSDKLDIGDRMKGYERCFEFMLPKRIPVIIRIDGRAFHSITRKYFGKTWSKDFTNCMAQTALYVMSDMQGCNFCYSQSDEISFLLTDYKTIRSNAWFGYDVPKIISISASLASIAFSKITGSNACFDSRCFSLPHDEVCNYFIWRQIDATRNAILMAGREHFSHKQLHKKNCREIRQMLLKEHNIDFDNYPTIRQRGFCIIKKEIDWNIPVFMQDREYIERWVNVRED